MNGSVFTRLSLEMIDSIANKLQKSEMLGDLQEFPQWQDSGSQNSQIDSNIILAGPVFFQSTQKGVGL